MSLLSPLSFSISQPSQARTQTILTGSPGLHEDQGNLWVRVALPSQGSQWSLRPLQESREGSQTVEEGVSPSICESWLPSPQG